MMDITRFLQEGAKFMATDRPDIWNIDSAFARLTEWYSILAGEEENGSISSGGFVLKKYESDGELSYELDRHILSFTIFEDDSETHLFDWTTDSALVDIGLNIPDSHEGLDDADNT